GNSDDPEAEMVIGGRCVACGEAAVKGNIGNEIDQQRKAAGDIGGTEAQNHCKDADESHTGVNMNGVLPDLSGLQGRTQRGRYEYVVCLVVFVNQMACPYVASFYPFFPRMGKDTCAASEFF